MSPQDENTIRLEGRFVGRGGTRRASALLNRQVCLLDNRSVCDSVSLSGERSAADFE
jgi:hypothetical protein